MAGEMRVDISVTSEEVSVDFAARALASAARRRGTHLEIRKKADACRRCKSNNDPMKVLSGELHTGYRNNAQCKCRVVEVDDRGQERLVTG